jgi:hypothetical protein
MAMRRRVADGPRFGAGEGVEAVMAEILLPVSMPPRCRIAVRGQALLRQPPGNFAKPPEIGDRAR